MMRLVSQVAAVTWIGLASLPRRAGLSVATVGSVGIVVGVLLGFQSMGTGFQKTVEGSGSETVAVITRSGSQSELNSVIGREQVNLISDAPGIARVGDRPLVSAELYVVVDAIKKSSNTEVNMPLRGIAAEGAMVRDNIEIVEGRMFTPGTTEIVVGQGVLEQFTGFEMGRTVRLGTGTWTVVGVFTAQGTVFDSELWADARVVQSQFNRGSSFQTVRAQLATPGDVSAIQSYIENDPRLRLDVATEKDYFSAQSSGTVTLINVVAYPISIIMALGALAGALNTMYTSVAARARDIATLRAIGYGGFSAFAGTLAESLLLALIGGVIGSLVAFVTLDGLSASTLGGSFTQVVFAFELSPQLIGQGAVLALIIGLIGGIFPAWRAARLPVAVAFSNA